MYRLFLIFLISSILLYSIQSQELRKNVIQFNIIGPTLKAFDANEYRMNVSYERGIRKWFSMAIEYEQGRFKYNYFTDPNGNPLREYWLDVKGGDLLFRFFPFYIRRKVEAPNGFFFSFYYRHLWADEQVYEISTISGKFDKTIHEKGNLLGMGFDIGYKFGKIITLEPLIGVSPLFQRKLNTNPRTKYFFGPTKLRQIINFELRIGISLRDPYIT